jgi:hypothetical protein
VLSFNISAASYFAPLPACEIALLAGIQGPGSLENAVTKASPLLKKIIIEVREQLAKTRSSSVQNQTLENFYYIPVFHDNQQEEHANFSRSLSRLESLFKRLQLLDEALLRPSASSHSENSIVFASNDESEIREFVWLAQKEIKKWKWRSDVKTACALTGALLCAAGGGLASFYSEKNIYGLSGIGVFFAFVLKSRNYIFNTQSPFTAFFNEISYNLNIDDLPTIYKHPFNS